MTDNFAAHEIIKDLLDEGYDYQDIKNALEDGEFLSTQDWAEEDIDDAHYICVERLRHG